MTMLIDWMRKSNHQVPGVDKVPLLKMDDIFLVIITTHHPLLSYKYSLVHKPTHGANFQESYFINDK